MTMCLQGWCCKSLCFTHDSCIISSCITFQRPHILLVHIWLQCSCQWLATPSIAHNRTTRLIELVARSYSLCAVAPETRFVTICVCKTCASRSLNNFSGPCEFYSRDDLNFPMTSLSLSPQADKVPAKPPLSFLPLLSSLRRQSNWALATSAQQLILAWIPKSGLIISVIYYLLFLSQISPQWLPWS